MTIALRPVSLAWMLILAACLTACPGRQTRRTLVPDVPTTGDARARDRFQDARAKFLRDGKDTGEFTRIVDEYPEDPIVPWAQLYAGIADVKARKIDHAVQVLTEVIETRADPGLTARARLFLGIAKNYQGDAAGALALLRSSDRAVEDDTDRTEYLAALAYATAAAGDPPIRSLAIFDQLYPRVTPTEKAALVLRIEEVVATAEPNLVRRAFDELPDRKGPSIAIVASRLVALAEQAGNSQEAQRMREIAAPARVALGLPRVDGAAGAAAGAAAMGLIGAVVPLGGKSNRIAEAAVAGLGLAAGVGDGKAVAAIEVRAAGDSEAVGIAVEDLARGNVIAIIGPTDKDAVDAAGPRAEALGVPMLSLSGRAEKHATWRTVFHMMHSGEARARALAQRALGKGVTKFAVLAPESGYGKTLSAAFVDEVGRGGGTILSSVTYKADTKSFAGIAGKLTGAWDAIFIPEDAATLALIAPALDAAGQKPRPLGTRKVRGGRPVLLLSTAENLTGAFLTDAGRHAEGAFLAPGYYPDDQDPASTAFVDRFITTFGRAPGFVEAYAFDAAQLAAAAGGGGRAGLAAGLSKAQFVGLTGTIRFDAEHRRADPGVIYTVVEETGGYAIRIAK
ncbi:MAG TPA: penicillin-binding protein activator [Kofleriaceae bacterium]|nr:penicillin-binding protein activator [Kofleriaceae bacterium]